MTKPWGDRALTYRCIALHSSIDFKWLWDFRHYRSEEMPHLLQSIIVSTGQPSQTQQPRNKITKSVNPE